MEARLLVVERRLLGLFRIHLARHVYSPSALISSEMRGTQSLLDDLKSRPGVDPETIKGVESDLEKKRVELAAWEDKRNKRLKGR